MRASLAKWIGDADALRHLDQFQVTEVPVSLAYQRTRKDELFVSLVGELFERMRNGYDRPVHWARLGAAFAQYISGGREADLGSLSVSLNDTILFAAAAFYFGGFPASAYLTMRSHEGVPESETARACFDLLARPREIGSDVVRDLVSSLLRGDMTAIESSESRASENARSALQVGPEVYVPARLLEKLLARFRSTNIRAVLPEGSSEFWTPLVSSFLNEGIWDFFPSQIQALQSGLLQRQETVSLQMPTSAGKTSLCETLLYWHLKRTSDDVAVFLVPYRSLASELRNTLVKRLNRIGISARCAYGGSVPSGDEAHALDAVRALIATPEALSGILTANQLFLNRISLVICDEGHLLDAPTRGVGLELLLARLRTRRDRQQKFVFVSAIVPNVEEINSWLGGQPDSVVRSDYRAALAEFAVLRTSGTQPSSPIDLEMHPHEQPPIRFNIDGFLTRKNFLYTNPATGRLNTYSFASVKTRAVAAARMALTMGGTVVFASNKRGDQGAIGLAEELLDQTLHDLRLPRPIDHCNRETISDTAEYLELEYGSEWIGTRALKAGAVLHHGDIPQESREVVESILRKGHSRFGICTSTLAEGVNLPIRTLVLYSVRRRGAGGRREDLLTRDIKNLVGRAGRAGTATKGLVICANGQDWPLVEPVAKQAPGEAVIGALRSLIENVRRALAVNQVDLSNELLERSPRVYALIDGIDSTLLDLAATELGEEELVRLATELADQTFAARQTDAASKELLRNVFVFRARRVAALRISGRLDWLRETGTRVRMMDLVETGLLPLRPSWDNVDDPNDTEVLNTILSWAWTHPDLLAAVRSAYREDTSIDTVRQSFFQTVKLWLSGKSFRVLAEEAQLSVDDLLGLHARAIAFSLQTIVEQAVALLNRILLAAGRTLAPAIVRLPDHLRFGVPTLAGVVLANGGVRHRRAYVELAQTFGHEVSLNDSRSGIFERAQRQIEQDLQGWKARLGALVLENTRHDLAAVISGQQN